MGSFGDDNPPSSVKSTDEGRMKFLCSHGGKILPKSDGQLRYVGGDTRLVSLHRNIGFSELMSRVEKLFGPNLWLKYQLPNEDLDTLISVTCDEDVENLIEEYDRNEGRDGGSRLRAFLFPKAGMPMRVAVSSSSDQSLDEPPKSPRNLVDHIAPPAAVKHQTDTAATSFQVPDYLFGFDSTGNPLAHQQQQQQQQQQQHHHHHYHQQYHHHHQHQHLPHHQQLQDADIFSLNDASSDSQAQRFPTSLALQAEYLRQQAATIDSGGRSPALTTSALGPLVSNHPQLWDRDNTKGWDGRIHGEQRADRNQMEQRMDKYHHELNGETNHKQGGIPRVQSKERILQTHIEGALVDPHLTADSQERLQPYLRTERQNTDELQSDARGAPPITRQELSAQGGSRFYKTSDVQHRNQLPVGVTSIEMLWVGPPSGFDMVTERSAESCRNSGGSDEGLQCRIEGYATAENAPHPHSTAAITLGTLDGFKFQDALDVHRAEEQHQHRHGEFDGSHMQHEAHVHHLGKAHFQQVHWQMHDSPEHLQPQASQHEPIRSTHNVPPFVRHGHPLNYQVLSAGTEGNHQRMPRVIPRSDTMPHGRLPSSLYMQAALGGASRSEPQQLSRASSPLRDHTPSNAPVSSWYGHRGMQVHDMGYLPSSKALQVPGPSVGQVFLDGAEGQGLPEQIGHSGRQLHHPEKGVHDIGTGQAHYMDKFINQAVGRETAHEIAIGQAHYMDKIAMANQGLGRGQLHYVDDNMQAKQ